MAVCLAKEQCSRVSRGQVRCTCLEMHSQVKRAAACCAQASHARSCCAMLWGVQAAVRHRQNSIEAFMSTKRYSCPCAVRFGVLRTVCMAQPSSLDADCWTRRPIVQVHA